MKPFWSRVGTKEFESKLLGLIRIGQRLSVSNLALATNVSKMTVVKQMYRWVECGQHLDELRHVNWAWNRHGTVPKSYRTMYEQPAAKNTSFEECLITEMIAQHTKRDLVKLRAIIDLLKVYRS